MATRLVGTIRELRHRKSCKLDKHNPADPRCYELVTDVVEVDEVETIDITPTADEKLTALLAIIAEAPDLDSVKAGIAAEPVLSKP
jgi:hypothetical protein